jgi:predicted metal-dependent enzyme (double-stranded beta helix superfamily)
MSLSQARSGGTFALPSKPRPWSYASPGHPENLSDLVDPIRSAIRHDRVGELARTLTQLHRCGTLEQDGLFAPGSRDHYTRRLVWLEPDASFVVIAMTWLPGQASPLHDHAGLSGAEIVVDGEMHESTFRLKERHEGGRYRFARDLDRIVAKGAVGIVNPPYEYHDFGNAGSTTAHTLHVYGGDLQSCQAFEAEDDGWWRSRRVDLHYDA